MFVLCATGKRKPRWGDSGGSNRKEQGSDKEEMVAAGDPIYISDTYCSTPGQKKMDRHDTVS